MLGMTHRISYIISSQALTCAITIVRASLLVFQLDTKKPKATITLSAALRKLRVVQKIHFLYLKYRASLKLSVLKNQ
jgi:hypothetical protein